MSLPQIYRFPNLVFDLVDYADGINSIALYCKSAGGRMAIEVMDFNEAGLVRRVVAHYR